MYPTAYPRNDLYGGYSGDYMMTSHSHNFQPPSPPPASAVQTIDHPNNPDDVKSKRKREASSSRIRKPPEAPKRFKSSYILFFMAKQKEIKDEIGEGASVGEISKRSSEMWKSLSAEERAIWDAKAEEDKERYKLEKEKYTGPWQVPWKRAKKNPDAPKRPMSAFLFYSQDKRRSIKQANPGMRNTEISRVLGDMWKKATAEEKAPHIEREAVEREKYKVDMAKWKEEETVRQREIAKEEKAQQRSEKKSKNALQVHVERMSPAVHERHSLSPLPLPPHHQPHLSPAQGYYHSVNPDYYTGHVHSHGPTYNLYGSYHPPPPPPPSQSYYHGYPPTSQTDYHRNLYQQSTLDYASVSRHGNVEDQMPENSNTSPSQALYNNYYSNPLRGYDADHHQIARSHSDDYPAPL